MVRGLFNELPKVQGAELGVYLVATPEMTRLNETFLQHAGSTDVITFDYAELGTRKPELGTRRHRCPGITSNLTVFPDSPLPIALP